ncbi:MAG: hypothetical protein K1X87_00215 [Dehalococcoidia bacterium]|nr:hypothetical protein [Dehalococcoidia bacterium]HRC62001.1 hypothetical protein [Dehalococcoidia bacterium]
MQQYTDRLRQRYVHEPVQWGTLAGLLLMVIGVFGPWATVSIKVLGISASTNGMDHKGDIVFIIALAAAAAIVAYAFLNVRIEERMLMWGLVAAALIIDLLVLLDFLDIMGTDGVGIGWGLWLTVVGAAAFTAGAVVPMWSEIRAKASDMTERGQGA